MNTKSLILLVAAVFFLSSSAFGQGFVKRTTYKSDKLDFGVGGTLAVVGAPNGSVRIEGWSNREIEISAVIEMEAPTEADLNTLAKVTGFITQESLGRTGVISVGTHDKKYVKSVDKKFPKALYGLPFKVDYVIKVPKYCDLQIDGGKGSLSITGVEGNMKINYLDSDAKIELVGGGILATIGTGDLEVTIPSRSWRSEERRVGKDG